MYSMHSDPMLCILEKMYTFVSVKCSHYKILFQCLRILEVNLKLEIRMSFSM